ncbi:MAG: AAA domain-containing protein, partial [Tannerellaceae bacterium]
VLRIGNPTRVNDKMLSFTYEKRFEAHPDYAELWSIRKAIRETQSALRRKSAGERETARNRLSRLRFRATELEVQIDNDLFNEARVIACTLVGAANRVLTNRHFSTLFIDEAAQALEAACWIGIGKADRVILAGDHQQLPPTIKCIEAARGGLDHTLLEKVATGKPEVVSLLTVQYRMHDDIMRFPSRWFYHGKLQSAPEVKHRGILEYDTPMVWIDTNTDTDDTGEQQQGEGMSRLNKTEAEQLVSNLKSYVEKIGKERVLDEGIDFGLISPYKAQVHYLRNLIRSNDFFKPLRRLITIHTVDGFQGQERDVILISLVRSNEQGQIGFLGDLRRMNVAITRARMKLIIIGDATTLTRHAFYRELYAYIAGL